MYSALNTVAVVSQKGGSGKTTIAVALAAAHTRADGQATVIDLDPQMSAMTWGQLRNNELPMVASAHPPRLARAVETARSAGADLVVIDTGPREAGGAAEAARLADLVLVPCRPSTVDLAAVPVTLAVLANTPAVVVLNACPPRGSWTDEATEVLGGISATVCPVTFGARVAHARAFTLGRTAQEMAPRSKAAAEIERLYRWTMEET